MARFSSVASLAYTMVVALAVVTPVKADLMLTAAGITDGFTLTEFVGGYNFGGGVNYGPLAQGILPNGNVVTGSYGDGKIYVFNDTDGQTLGSAVSATTYAGPLSPNQWAMTTAGGQAYGARQSGGVYEQFANNGSFTPIPNLQAAGLLSNQGMWGDPLNGHIISASNHGLVEIDPVAGTFRVINGTLFGHIDGVALSPDGSTVYVANFAPSEVDSYNFTTGALIQTFPVTSGRGPDGTGVISGGLFNGDVIVNNNDGTVGLLNPSTSSYTIIADSGTRGDWVSPDTSNGTLFISQLESVDRLSCGPGCSIGGPPPVPEPSSIVLLGSVLVASFASLRRRLRKHQQ
jgi:hypothetical protein